MYLPGMLLVAACWRSTTPPPTPPVENHSAITSSPLEITLSRTVCFGTCPEYTVTIHGDGRVDWLGKEYVDVTGERHARISQAQLDELAATIDRIGFFGLDDHGAPPADPMADVIICSDTPHAVVTVERGGQRHTTDNDHCTAAPVDALEDQIDAVAQTAQWIGAGHL